MEDEVQSQPMLLMDSVGTVDPQLLNLLINGVKMATLESEDITKWETVQYAWETLKYCLDSSNKIEITEEKANDIMDSAGIIIRDAFEIEDEDLLTNIVFCVQKALLALSHPFEALSSSKLLASIALMFSIDSEISRLISICNIIKDIAKDCAANEYKSSAEALNILMIQGIKLSDEISDDSIALIYELFESIIAIAQTKLYNPEYNPIIVELFTQFFDSEEVSIVDKAAESLYQFLSIDTENYNYLDIKQIVSVLTNFLKSDFPNLAKTSALILQPICSNADYLQLLIDSEVTDALSEGISKMSKGFINEFIKCYYILATQDNEICLSFLNSFFRQPEITDFNAFCTAICLDFAILAIENELLTSDDDLIQSLTRIATSCLSFEDQDVIQKTLYVIRYLCDNGNVPDLIEQLEETIEACDGNENTHEAEEILKEFYSC